MLRALYRLGFDWEALEYFAFVLEAVSGRGDKIGSKVFDELQIMYGIGGERDLTEKTLDHLSGSRATRPRCGWATGHEEPAPERRLGHAARRRRFPFRRGRASGIVKPGVWEGLAATVDDGHREEEGEGRTRASGKSEVIPSISLPSKVLCWVAADRGADLAPRYTVTMNERRTGGRKSADGIEGRHSRQGR